MHNAMSSKKQMQDINTNSSHQLGGGGEMIIWDQNASLSLSHSWTPLNQTTAETSMNWSNGAKKGGQNSSTNIWDIGNQTENNFYRVIMVLQAN